jgi:3-oxoacyl-[acyl-carrier-protein] synthase II
MSFPFRRIVVTGVGLVTPFGSDLNEVWHAFKTGRSGVSLVTPPDGSASGPILGAPVTGFSPRDYVDAKSLRLMAPAVAFGVGAAQLATTDAGLQIDALDPARFGVFVGSRGHSSDRQDLMAAVRLASRDGTFRLNRFGAEGLPLVHPMWLLKGLANNVLYFVSLKYNAQGMNNNISMGGVAGTMAIGEAFEALRRGFVDVALAGAYDSALDPDRIEMFGISGLVTTSNDAATASRPFDRRRSGFVPGEGAGFFVLETLESATRRGAKIYGEIRGYGSTAGPFSPVHLGPSATGFASALAEAIANADGVTPDAVFTHGLGTITSDAEETRALKTVFGGAARTIPAPALKSMIGNTFAASGMIEAAAACFALRDGYLPPTVNLTDPDPACDLDYVPGTEGRRAALTTVALNNVNLGGAHASLVLGRLA